MASYPRQANHRSALRRSKSQKDPCVKSEPQSMETRAGLTDAAEKARLSVARLREIQSDMGGAPFDLVARHSRKTGVLKKPAFYPSAFSRTPRSIFDADTTGFGSSAHSSSSVQILSTQPRFHRWRDPQRLMHSAKVVMHVVQRNRVTVIVNFLTESVCQARKASLHMRIVRLWRSTKARADVLRVGIAAHNFHVATDARAGE